MHKHYSKLVSQIGESDFFDDDEMSYSEDTEEHYSTEISVLFKY